jgi:hypothetical protein
LNGTVAEVSFFRAFRDAVKQTLAEQEQQQSGACVKLVAMATFSPSHFKGQWNEGAPCKKKAETETRKIVVEEVEEASSSTTLRFAAVDVTALATRGRTCARTRSPPATRAAGLDTFNQILLLLLQSIVLR